MNYLYEIDSSFSNLNENKLIGLCLNGNDKISDKKNHSILMPIIRFIKGSQTFHEHLL